MKEDADVVEMIGLQVGEMIRVTVWGKSASGESVRTEYVRVVKIENDRHGRRLIMEALSQMPSCGSCRSMNLWNEGHRPL